MDMRFYYYYIHPFTITHLQMKIVQQQMACRLFFLCLIFGLAQSLHLLHSASFDYSPNNLFASFSKDNLVGSNLNYYFGSLPPQSYYSWVAVNEKQSAIETTCSSSQPFAVYKDGVSSCMSCEPLTANLNVSTAKLLFNLQTRQCEVCTPGKTAICDSLLSSVVVSPNSSSNSKNQSQVLGLCPPSNPKYNPITNQCENCPILYQFSGQLQKCIPIVFTTNLEATNILKPALNSLDQQQYKIQQQNPTQLVRQCPIETPYLKDKTCISCPSNKLFNLASQECVQCGQGQFYNAITFTCDVGTYYTDATASNIVSPKSNYDQWKTNIEQLSQASPKMIKCKPDTPFVVGQKCISCNGDTPLFDIDSNKCVSCSRGRSYDSSKRLCVGSYSSGGSLRLMIANVL